MTWANFVRGGSTLTKNGLNSAGSHLPAIAKATGDHISAGAGVLSRGTDMLATQGWKAAGSHAMGKYPGTVLAAATAGVATAGYTGYHGIRALTGAGQRDRGDRDR